MLSPIILLSLVMGQQPAREQPVEHLHIAAYGVHPLNRPATPGAGLNYYGGPVISNVQVVVIFWGSNVDPTVTSQIGGFYQGVTNSSYFDLLQEYDTNITPLGGGFGTNQTIGRGTFAGAYTIVPSVCGSSPCTIDDSQIQSELLAQMNAGHVPPPSFDNSANLNTVYMIYFPPGVISTLRQWTSCAPGGFCAYHYTTSGTYYSRNLAYGVFPDFGSGSGCDVGCGYGTEFQNLTSVSSHELAESVTDVDVGIGSTSSAPLAWSTSTGQEIGDLCNQQESNVSTPTGAYTVQQLWSNVANACVTTGAHPVYTLAAPTGATSGTAFSFTVTVTNAGKVDATYGGTAHFTSSDPQAILPPDYSFSPANNGAATFSATLHGTGHQTISATDTSNASITGGTSLIVSGGSSPGSLNYSPSSLAWSSWTVNSTGHPKTVTFTNTSGSPVSISGVSLIGSDAANFALSNPCGTTLATNQSCKMTLTFTPLSVGNKSASLQVADNAANSPQLIGLSGIGIAPVHVGPLNNVFPARPVGSSTPPITINVRNYQQTTLTFSASPFAFTGANTADFVESATTCGTTLPANALCTVSIVFTPSAKGLRTAQFSVSDDAAGSPQTVNLSGTGK
ncbi:MAG: choice-of-anchor D domain-containing protein [Acidobacteriales bacterium]|nr:choice-of-anchor D domain-containing protein [Terriglobales bacterium]